MKNKVMYVTMAVAVVVSLLASALGFPGSPGRTRAVLGAPTTTWYEQNFVSSSANSVRAGHWVYQTFTPSVAHYFNTAQLCLYKIGSPNYTVTIALYSVDADHKPLSLLCSTTLAASSLTTKPTLLTYIFWPGWEMAADAEYALVLSGNAGTTAAYVAVSANMSGDVYTRGSEGKSTDSGSTWTAFVPAQDIYFREGSTTPSDVYVSTSGSDLTGNGSQGNPWKTIQYAINHPVVVDGCTVNVVAGTYTETDQIVIDKDLSIVGADKASTIIRTCWRYRYRG